MSAVAWDRRARTAGFTLIEVIGALVILSVGVLMVIQLSANLGTQMEYAAQRSEITVLAHERLDSLEALPFDSVTVGTYGDTVDVNGRAYQRLATVAMVTAILMQIDVTMSPVTPGAGPSYTATSYAAAEW